MFQLSISVYRYIDRFREPNEMRQERRGMPSPPRGVRHHLLDQITKLALYQQQTWLHS